MRNAMLATIVLVLCAAMVSTASLLPGFIDSAAGPPPPAESATSPAAVADAALLHKNGVSGYVPGRDEKSRAPRPFVAGWAEQMFTHGTVKDFGAVPFGTRLAHRFQVTNVHSVPVEISGVSTSCGCLVATRGKRVLQPGESTTINVNFDTREFTGANTETVRVAVGPNPVSTCKLTVSAVSRTDVAFTPERINLGFVAPGQAAVQTMEIEYRGARDWKIEEVTVPKELPVEAKLNETSGQGRKIGYRLQVALKRDAPPGRIRDYVYLRTNQPGEPLMPVLVSAIVKEPQDGHPLERASSPKPAAPSR